VGVENTNDVDPIYIDAHLSLDLQGVVDSINPVPEPATMLLLGSGLIGLAGFRRKKFKK
jgi:PEP-CTERM motif